MENSQQWKILIWNLKMVYMPCSHQMVQENDIDQNDHNTLYPTSGEILYDGMDIYKMGETYRDVIDLSATAFWIL